MAKDKAKLSDFTVQQKNVNRHKTRGMKALRDTIDEGGWVGAITTAANGETFAGSARLEVSYDRFGDEIEPITVHTTGDRPVIVIRDDIPTASDPKAVKLGVADNRISEINYDPDIELLIEINDEIIQLDDLYYEDELAALVASNEDEDQGDTERAYKDINSSNIDAAQDKLDSQFEDRNNKGNELITCPHCGGDFVYK